jgi:transposase InsO family protein
MIPFIFSILHTIILLLFCSKKDLLSIISVLQKENEIFKRTLKNNNLSVRFTNKDRIIFSFFRFLSGKINEFFTLVKPDTVLKWYRNIIRNHWDFSSHSRRKPGRPQTPADVRNLILDMKNDNPKIRTGKIQGELLKLGIELSLSTIRRILAGFRREGKIKSSMTWKTFIKLQFDKLYAMDFLTVTTLFGKTMYVFFIMYLKTREIVQYRVTDVPSASFVRNQLRGFMDDREDGKIYLIHDGSGEFICQDYTTLGIHNVRISPLAPNMNAYAERFIGSLRRECLDWFILISYNQLDRIIREYIKYYNTQRPHQGLMQDTPKGYTPQAGQGKICKRPVLSGLWYHYYREAA